MFRVWLLLLPGSLTVLFVRADKRHAYLQLLRVAQLLIGRLDLRNRPAFELSDVGLFSGGEG